MYKLAYKNHFNTNININKWDGWRCTRNVTSWKTSTKWQHQG